MDQTTTGPIFGNRPDDEASREDREKSLRHEERDKPSSQEDREKSFGHAEETVNRIADATASTVREVGMKGEQMRQQLLTTQDAWVSNARDCVRNHPLASVAIAAGLGMLFSRLRR